MSETTTQTPAVKRAEEVEKTPVEKSGLVSLRRAIRVASSQ